MMMMMMTMMHRATTTTTTTFEYDPARHHHHHPKVFMCSNETYTNITAFIICEVKMKEKKSSQKEEL